MTSWQRFWNWYERHYHLHTIIVAGIFTWQLVHLYWLTTAVVIPRLTGITLFDPSPFFEFLLIIVDYTEIPALISATLLYVHALRKGFQIKPLLFIILLNSQWLHLFWITDEFVVEQFTAASIALPVWLAWLAIMIDYLELPVIADTLWQAARSIMQRVHKNSPALPESK